MVLVAAIGEVLETALHLAFEVLNPVLTNAFHHDRLYAVRQEGTDASSAILLKGDPILSAALRDALANPVSQVRAELVDIHRVGKVVFGWIASQEAADTCHHQTGTSEHSNEHAAVHALSPERIVAAFAPLVLEAEDQQLRRAKPRGDQRDADHDGHKRQRADTASA